MALTGWANSIICTFDSPASNLTDVVGIIKICRSSGKNGYDTAKVMDEVGANSLKIALEVGDSGVETYGEIRYWDAVNFIGEIAIKIPSALAASQPVVILYFDNTHADNSTYIGPVGSAAGQTVYEAGFNTVYSLAQDPSGGAGCVLDSTSNANHGTPGGTMVAGDLTADSSSNIGLNFDGTDDLITGTQENYTGLTVLCRSRSDVNVNSSPVGKGFEDPYAWSLTSLVSGSGLLTYARTWDSAGVLRQQMGQTHSWSVDSWRTLAMRVGASGLFAYYDGVLEASLAIDLTLGTLNESLEVADSALATNTNPFDGDISDVMIVSAEKSHDWISWTSKSLNDEVATYANNSNDVVFELGDLLSLEVQFANDSIGDIAFNLEDLFSFTAEVKPYSSCSINFDLTDLLSFTVETGAEISFDLSRLLSFEVAAEQGRTASLDFDLAPMLSVTSVAAAPYYSHTAFDLSDLLSLEAAVALPPQAVVSFDLGMLLSFESQMLFRPLGSEAVSFDLADLLGLEAVIVGDAVTFPDLRYVRGRYA